MKFLFKKLKELKRLHCVERVKRNKDHEAPTFVEMFKLSEESEVTDWFMLPPWNNIFHDDNKGLPEIKFSNLDGREYIYGPRNNSYNGEYIFMYGSYNYFPVITNAKNPKKFFILAYMATLHLFFDMIPGWIFNCED